MSSGTDLALIAPNDVASGGVMVFRGPAGEDPHPAANSVGSNRPRARLNPMEGGEPTRAQVVAAIQSDEECWSETGFEPAIVPLPSLSPRLTMRSDRSA